MQGLKMALVVLVAVVVAALISPIVVVWLIADSLLRWHRLRLAAISRPAHKRADFYTLDDGWEPVEPGDKES